MLRYLGSLVVETGCRGLDARFLKARLRFGVGSHVYHERGDGRERVLVFGFWTTRFFGGLGSVLDDLDLGFAGFEGERG